MTFVSLKARVFADATGASFEIPVLITPEGVLEPLLDYCLSRSHDRSVVWMKKVVRAATLFLEYAAANLSEFDSYILFQNFSQRLYTGTFDRVTGVDPSGLCWPPKSAQAAGQVIGQLSDFFDWLADSRPSAAKVNPRYAGNRFDRMADEAAYQYRRSHALLGHTWARSSTLTSVGHRVRATRSVRVEHTEPPAFPDERFMDLLTDGFVVGGRRDYRGMLITLLLHSAGFRESEPFHLYVGDVFPDPSDSKRAQVLIHHPSQGHAPADWLNEHGKRQVGSRANYLAQKFGLAPRTDLLDSRAAGWKGGTHDGPFYKQAHWFLPEHSELFMQLWLRYLEQVARISRDHPYAFINLGREPKGGVYCLAQFNKAHAAACRRIGLQVGKELGTTPHGHRHAYGLRLRRARVEKSYIRRFMHHSALESQEVYTQPNPREMRDELAAAAARLCLPRST